MPGPHKTFHNMMATFLVVVILCTAFLFYTLYKKNQSSPPSEKDLIPSVSVVEQY